MLCTCKRLRLVWKMAFLRIDESNSRAYSLVMIIMQIRKICPLEGRREVACVDGTKPKCTSYRRIRRNARASWKPNDISVRKDSNEVQCYRQSGLFVDASWALWGDCSNDNITWTTNKSICPTDIVLLCQGRALGHQAIFYRRTGLGTATIVSSFTCVICDYFVLLVYHPCYSRAHEKPAHSWVGLKYILILILILVRKWSWYSAFSFLKKTLE